MKILHYNSFLGIDRWLDIHLEQNFWETFSVPMGATLLLFFNLISVGVLYFQARKISGKRGGGKAQLETVNFLAGRLMLGGNLVLQIIVLVYVIAIFLVNK
jgi:hypothetical protein